MWAGIAFINWIGPLAYFTIGRKDGLSGLMEQCRALTQSCRKSEAAEA
jgi:hypothetical protein